MSTDQGRKILTAPAVFVSAYGTKRAVAAIDDVIWITVHVTNETDLAVIERDLIVTDPLEWDDLAEHAPQAVMEPDWSMLPVLVEDDV